MKLRPQPYNPAWKTGFEQLKTALETLLDEPDADIQHVGSTAVPGLYAKPVLDIDIIIRDHDLLPVIAARLEQYGYLSKGDQGIPGRFAFRQSAVYTPATEKKQEWPVHHLYVCYADSLALKNHLLFRDALLQDKILADQYSRLKQSVAAYKKISGEEYTRRKTEFILSVLAKTGLSDTALKEIRNANR
jgi:GrpB-like predicted nucleotidyltransferase (UPF0157 family)